MKLQCKHCGYSWGYKGNPDYKGKRFYATCPRCRYKVKIDRKIDDQEEEP